MMEIKALGSSWTRAQWTSFSTLAYLIDSRFAWLIHAS